MMNKPDKPGYYYWREDGDNKPKIIDVWVSRSGGELRTDHGIKLDDIGGIWLGPVPGYGESFTVPEIEAYLNSFFALCDATFSVGHKEHGIKAFTERSRAQSPAGAHSANRKARQNEQR